MSESAVDGATGGGGGEEDETAVAEQPQEEESRPARLCTEATDAGRAHCVGHCRFTGRRVHSLLLLPPPVVRAHMRQETRLPVASSQTVYCALLVPHDAALAPLSLLGGEDDTAGDARPAPATTRRASQQNRTHILVTPDPIYAVYVRNTGQVIDLRMRRETPRWRLDVVLGPFVGNAGAAFACSQRWLEGTRGRSSKRQCAPALAREFGVNWYAYDAKTLDASATAAATATGGASRRRVRC